MRDETWEMTHDRWDMRELDHLFNENNEIGEEKNIIAALRADKIIDNFEEEVQVTGKLITFLDKATEEYSNP